MSASGPQAERLSAYTREADLGYPEGRDALRGPAVAGREHALHTQLARMKTTVEHLQQVVQRQEIVINDYQIKYPSLSPNTSSSSSPEEEEKAVAGLPPWVSDPLLMSPLLVAYDERLGELQAANGILSEQVSKQKLTHDEITKENAGLRADLKNYVERMLAYTEGGGGGGIGGGALGSLGSSEQMNELVEMNDVLNKTNSIMSEQITMLESHLNASRTALTEAQEQLAGETKQSQEQAAALTQLSVLNRSLEMERDETVRRLQTATGDLAAIPRDLAIRSRSLVGSYSSSEGVVSCEDFPEGAAALFALRPWEIGGEEEEKTTFPSSNSSLKLARTMSLSMSPHTSSNF